jgi:hypothetical protein
LHCKNAGIKFINAINERNEIIECYSIKPNRKYRKCAECICDGSYKRYGAVGVLKGLNVQSLRLKVCETLYIY